MRYIELLPNSKLPARAGWREECSTTQPEGNAGILLTGQYVVIDFDLECDEATQLRSSLEATWAQRTKRGQHWLYLIDETAPKKNEKLYTEDGRPFADLKMNGYIVAPGSIVDGFVYKRITASPEPVPFSAASTHVQKYRKKLEAPLIFDSEGGGVTSSEHDAWLIKLGGWLRGQGGLSEARILEVMRKGPLAALEGVDPARPYTDADLRRIAHSAGSYAIEKGREVKEKRRFQPAAEFDDSECEMHWLLDHFIPRGELILQYGVGGIGKSTWVSWLVGQAMRREKPMRCAIITNEEKFNRFLHRVIASHDPTEQEKYLFGPLTGEWVVPDDIAELAEIVVSEKIDLLYFDSIYDNFGIRDGSNAAEKARAALSSLVRLARDTDCTILGTFHENKTGQSLGSVEMINVPRVVIHATKKKGQNTVLEVVKTNFSMPSSTKEIIGEWIPEYNSHGEQVRAIMQDGVTQAQQIYVVRNLKQTDEDEDCFSELPMMKAVLAPGHECPVLAPTEDSDEEGMLKAARARDPEFSKNKARKLFGWGWPKTDRLWDLTAPVTPNE